MVDADELLKETLWHIDAKADEFGWDMPPQLWFVLVLESEGLAAVHLIPVPGWEEVLSASATVPDALGWVREAVLSRPDGLTTPKTIYGVAFTVEAWSVSVEIMPEVTADTNLSTHPDRFETRVTYCCSREGVSNVLIHERDGIAQVVERNEVDGVMADLVREIAVGMT